MWPIDGIRKKQVVKVRTKLVMYIFESIYIISNKGKKCSPFLFLFLFSFVTSVKIRIIQKRALEEVYDVNASQHDCTHQKLVKFQILLMNPLI